MADFDPYAAFPRFYANDDVQALAKECRWSVSDRDKMPINMRALMSGGELRGAHEITPECLLTLEELTTVLPTAANNAFYLRGRVDGYAVLDIEPSAPPELAQELLALPSLYTERSMSGNGYHMLMPLPDNFWDHPGATAKKALAGPDRYYEVLLEHWVTFTRAALPRTPGQERCGLGPAQAWEDLYAGLAAHVTESPTSGLDISATKPVIPNEALILASMTTAGTKRAPAGAGEDMSAYEFSVLGTMRRQMMLCIAAFRTAYPDTSYGPDEYAWLLYEAAVAVLPHREKHDSTRNGMPLLFDRALWVLSHHVGESP